MVTFWSMFGGTFWSTALQGHSLECVWSHLGVCLGVSLQRSHFGVFHFRGHILESLQRSHFGVCFWRVGSHFGVFLGLGVTQGKISDT